MNTITNNRFFNKAVIDGKATIIYTPMSKEDISGYGKGFSVRYIAREDTVNNKAKGVLEFNYPFEFISEFNDVIVKHNPVLNIVFEQNVPEYRNFRTRPRNAMRKLTNDLITNYPVEDVINGVNDYYIKLVNELNMSIFNR